MQDAVNSPSHRKGLAPLTTTLTTTKSTVPAALTTTKSTVPLPAALTTTKSTVTAALTTTKSTLPAALTTTKSTVTAALTTTKSTLPAALTTTKSTLPAALTTTKSTLPAALTTTKPTVTAAVTAAAIGKIATAAATAKASIVATARFTVAASGTTTTVTTKATAASASPFPTASITTPTATITTSSATSNTVTVTASSTTATTTSAIAAATTTTSAIAAATTTTSSPRTSFPHSTNTPPPSMPPSSASSSVHASGTQTISGTPTPSSTAPGTPTPLNQFHTMPPPSPLQIPPPTPTGQPSLMEEEVKVTGGAVIGVRAATPERLIQMCVESFTKNGLDDKQSDFVDVFFLMHQWFMTSEELAQAFIDLYQGCDETITCPMVACQHLPINTDCAIQTYKKMICQAVRYWIRKYPLHFDMETKVTHAVNRLSCLLQAEGNYKLKELVDVSKIPSYDWMRSMSVRNTTWGKHSRKVSLVFNHLEPKELAAQLTYLEYKAFRRVNFSDYKNYAATASLKDQPKLERSIALFNGLSQWVQCMVLSKATPQQRADVICKFIDVSKHLRNLQNFNTLMAIVGGLSHSALARLSKTISCLPPESQKTLVELTELLSSNNNFINYRKVYHHSSGSKIPILGVHLKDLISLHTALPDRVEGNLLNFRKMSQLAVILRELTRLQHQETIPVDANMDLVNTLRLSLDLYHTEDEIYELSLAREPRGSLSSPTTPTKPVVFADWLSGISPPDAETINKHVHDMVEAVFKNYDHDKDGFISHEEFDSIVGNFPFIDSFCVLDADKDGMISKREMKIYFVRANSHALRNSFKHAFTETTYFKPTFCIRCTGLLWGLIKQGWKCKECGINAHKHCKDLVVMECRSKGSKRCESLTNGGILPNDMTIMAKRKISQRLQKRNSPSHTCQQSTQTEGVIMRRSSSLRIMKTSDTCTATSSICVNSTSISTSATTASATATAANAVCPPSPSISNGTMDSPSSSVRRRRTNHHREVAIIDGEYYEEQALLYERLMRAEEAREKLINENSRLRSKLEIANDQITLLKSHIGVIRQNTIAFILEQMDALHMQRDTEV